MEVWANHLSDILYGLSRPEHRVRRVPIEVLKSFKTAVQDWIVRTSWEDLILTMLARCYPCDGLGDLLLLFSWTSVNWWALVQEKMETIAVELAETPRGWMHGRPLAQNQAERSMTKCPFHVHERVSESAEKGGPGTDV